MRRINWPWRILMLIIIGPSTVVGMGLAMQLGDLPLTEHRYDTNGNRVVRWHPVSPERADAMQTRIWCRAVRQGADNPELDAHLAQLRDSAAYRERCQGGA